MKIRRAIIVDEFNKFKSSKYDDVYRCQICNGMNSLSDKEYLDGSVILLEAMTKCKSCEHIGYWVTGHYESDCP